MNTIFALSSGQGKAGVAVIRISGQHARAALTALAGHVPKPRLASIRNLRNPQSGEMLDKSLVLWFPGPASFTGTDVVELHVHGGRAVIGAILDALGTLDGFRHAEAGEFTKQAFENGKLDLTAAEGLADLIDAETEGQRRQAFRQSSGRLYALYETWRTDLIAALASIEAELDFSDEGDVPEEVARRARETAFQLHNAIDTHLHDRRGGEILRDGFRVVIAGPPNAGKSSLLNALAGRDAAIVSSEAGTTRDVIEVRLDLGGFPVILMDTAGLREPSGDIEREGMRRTAERAQGADLVVWLEDRIAPRRPMPPDLIAGTCVELIRVLNKIDLAPDQPAPKDVSAISVKTGAGLDALIAGLTDRVRNAVYTGDDAVITRARHRHELRKCCAALDFFLAGAFEDLELRAEDLRQAAAALGRLTGRVDAEDILDRIFADFCIGK